MDDLKGRTAFITGAAGGIGLGMAQAFAERGVRLVLADIDEAALAESAAKLSAAGAEVLALELDIADRTAWARANDQAESRFGLVTLLCNNAGVSAPGRTVDAVPGEFWDRCVAINLTGAFNGVSAFVPAMKAAGRGGHIVNTASMSGLIVTPGQAVYNATKFAMVALSETLRLELAEERIGVSVLCPGPVSSRLWRTSRIVQGLPDIDTPPPESLKGGSAAPHALSARWVGERVVDAIVRNELYILTHPERRDRVEQRFDAILDAFDRAERPPAGVA